MHAFFLINDEDYEGSTNHLHKWITFKKKFVFVDYLNDSNF